MPYLLRADARRRRRVGVPNPRETEQAVTYVDEMMARALDLSAERQRLEGDIQAKSLLVGGISPPDMRRHERLRAQELLFLADAREARYRWERG